MTYFDFFLAPVVPARRADYDAFQRRMHTIFKREGAMRIVETWESDVPDGKLTSMPLAVQREAGEALALGFIEWPSKATRDAAWKKLEKDPGMQPANNPMPFDGKRMIFGGFEKTMES